MKLISNNQNGTPYYASPEIWQGLSIDSKWDIWSLGWWVYELMTLHVPFSAQNSKELFTRICTGVPDPFPDNHPYSEDLMNWVLWTLTVDPKLRPSAKDILSSEMMKGIRHFILKDDDFIESYKEPNIKLPLFLPKDRSKLDRRILAKMDDKYQYKPEKRKDLTGELLL